MWPAYVVGSVNETWLDAFELVLEDVLVPEADGAGVGSLTG